MRAVRRTGRFALLLVLLGPLPGPLPGVLAVAGCRLEIDLRSEAPSSTTSFDDAPGDDTPGDDPDPGPVGAAELVADDPLVDGSRASWVFLHQGLIWVGPTAAGDAAVRFTPDGEFVDRVRFEIEADDVAPHRSRNQSGSPFPSFGAPGCEPNTPACGPDNEDGPVLMGSARLADEEVLIAAGGRTRGRHAHVYLGEVVDDVVHFHYLDLADASGRDTLGLASIAVSDDGVLLGLRDRGRNGPRLLELMRNPALQDAAGAEARVASTCDPSAGDVCDLQGAAIPGLVDDDVTDPEGGPDLVSGVDAVLSLRVPLPGAEASEMETYVASAEGIARCHGPLTPAGAAHSPWHASTPTASAFQDARPIRSSSTSAPPLRERGVPGIAHAGGRLVFGRNTVLGPQLWSCDALVCDPGQWDLVPEVTAGAERVSIVQTVAGAIVVGTDAADGARLLQRTADGGWVPLVEESGLLGARLLSALPVADKGGVRLWVLTADEEGPPRLVRLFVSTP